MVMLPIGRTLFAVALLGFGTVSLLFVDFVHQLQPIAEVLGAPVPGHGPLALLTALALVAAGLSILTGVAMPRAALALAVFFGLWIVCLQVPSAYQRPILLRSPWWVRTFETVALIGGALILAGHGRGAKGERWLRTGRILFGVSLPVFGVLHFVYAQNVASLVPRFYPWPLLWAYLTGAGNIAGGIAIASGIVPRLAALLAGAMYGTYALTLHIPRAVATYVPALGLDDAAALQSARGGLTSCCVAIAMWGTAWIVAGAAPTAAAPATPSLDSSA
jgi:uncharacterized membrane protein YphA (DoxX/SURF4 family)